MTLGLVALAAIALPFVVALHRFACCCRYRGLSRRGALIEACNAGAGMATAEGLCLIAKGVLG